VTEPDKAASNEQSIPRLRETRYLRQLVGFEVYREFSGQEGSVKSENMTLEVVISVPSSDSKPVALIESTASGLSPSFTSSSTKHLLLEHYLLDQGLGVDGEGKLLSLEGYLAYGATTFRATDKRKIQAPSSYRYSGYVRDTEETGLYFCETRYYAEWIGRWTSPDQLGIAAGLNSFAM
jgi:RHS repeat-associated protein